MLEIIALYFLCKKNGMLATQKGLNPRTWKWYTILSWLLTEIIGVIIGIILYGEDNIIGVMSLGIISAFGGYLIIKFVLDKKPDFVEEEINGIGVDDLHPPKNEGSANV